MTDFDSESERRGAEFETRAEAVQQSGTDVKAWLAAIKLAMKHEKPWRESAKEAHEIYSGKKSKKHPFNILYSNTQTIVPAVYNTQPLPDIRPRYNNQDPVSKDAAQLLERGVSFMSDNYGLHDALKSVIFCACLRGRGVPRVRYEPELGTDIDPMTGEAFQTVKFQKVTCEPVDWDSLIIGPGKKWEEVPWIAFRHLMTREQMVAMSPEIGAVVPMEERINGCDEKTAEQAPSLFKRALVYEIWDKETGSVIFVASTYTEDALLRTQPQFNLSDFFPIPKPLYAVTNDDSLVPIVPYDLYCEQAEELNLITKRIKALVKCLKWRGVYIKGFEAFAEMAECDDGEFKPTENDFQVMSGMGLDKAVMFMPIADLIAVIEKLSVQREQVKQSIFEITGISDILRGQTKANETLGAQQIKAQWGSLRINDIQAEVQRMARDVIRMMAEIMAELFEPGVLSQISDTAVTPEIDELLKNDLLRRYKVDIETDSTIRADLTRSQENVSQFVQGFGSFIGAVGPAVQAGAMPLDVVIELLLAFSRNFRLGRQAEDALDKLKTNVEQQQMQQQQMAAQQQMMAQSGLMPPMQPQTMQQPMVGQ